MWDNPLSARDICVVNLNAMHQNFSISNVSWQNFLITFLILALIYWVAILALYYRREIKGLISGKKVAGTEAPPEKQSPAMFNVPDEEGNVYSVQENSAADEPDARGRNARLMPLSYELVDELRGVISEAAEKKTIKDELFFALQLPLRQQQYEGLRASPFQYAINNFIGTECDAHCGIQFSREELDMLWKK